MSNDKVQPIMALAEQFGWRLADPAFTERQVWVVRQALESAIREAIAAPGVADGYALVAIDQLNDWKSMANTVAILSTKKDRFAYGAALKQEIADVIADPANLTEVAPPTAEQPERPPYCGSGHCSCIECPYGSIKGGPAE